MLGVVRPGSPALFLIQPAPDFLDPFANDERFLPAVRHLMVVRAGDGVVVGRAQLALEVQHGVLRRADAPQPETLLPPAQEQFEPFLVLWKSDLNGVWMTNEN